MAKMLSGTKRVIPGSPWAIVFLPILFLGLGLVMSACSTINSQVYMKQPTLLKSGQTVAVLPLSVKGISNTTVVTSAGIDANGDHYIEEMSSTSAGTMSPAEYEPAVDLLLERLRPILKPASLISPDEVNKAMTGKRFATFENAVPEVAKTMNADIVAVCQVRDFNQRGPGYPNKAAATGHVDLTLYGRDGQVICSVASDAQLQAATTFSSTPSFTDFMNYALKEFARKIRVS